MTYARKNRSKWILVAFSLVGMMALMGAGCGDEEECSGSECSSSIATPGKGDAPTEGTCRRVCDLLYGGCTSFPANEKMQGTCRLVCGEGAFDSNVLACLSTADCNKDAVTECLDDEPVQRPPSENP